jgi:hypothetical protein
MTKVDLHTDALGTPIHKERNAENRSSEAHWKILPR